MRNGANTNCCSIGQLTDSLTSGLRQKVYLKIGLRRKALMYELYCYKKFTMGIFRKIDSSFLSLS